MTYKLLKDAVGNTGFFILRKTDFAHIPVDDSNTDYQEYKAWLDAGNTPEAAD